MKLLPDIKTATLILSLIASCGFKLSALSAAVETPQPPPTDYAALPASPRWTEEERALQRTAASKLLRDITAAVSKGDRQYTIPAGNYRFDGELAGDFAVKNAKDFKLEATGVTFWFGTKFGFRLRHCDGVSVRGLVIDTDPLPWWQGTIVAIDSLKKTMDLALDNGYPLPDAEDIKARHRALFFDKETRHELFLFDERIAELSLLGGNRVRVERFERANPFSAPLVPRVPRLGDKLVINNERWEGGNILLEDCGNILLENVTLYGSANFAFHESGGKGGNIYRNCRLIRRPGTNRLMASRGDAFHSTLMERGPLVEGCEISCAGDDLLAVQGFFSVIMEQSSPRDLLIASPFGRSMNVGSVLQFSRFPDGESLGTARIEMIEEVSDRKLIEAAQRLPERILQETQVRIRKLSSVAVFRVRIDQDVACKTYDLTACPDYSGAGAVIRNNYLHDGHIRGVLIKTNNATVENNRIERTGHGGIVFEAELFWLEGPFNSHAIIRDNQLTDIGGAALDEKGVSVTIAAIQVGNYFGQRLFPRMLTTGNQNSEIEISRNRIVRPVAFPIWVRNADRVVIRDNRITAPFNGGMLPAVLDLSRLLSPAASTDASGLRILREPYFGVLLQNVTGADVRGNEVSATPKFYKGDVGAVTLNPSPLNP